MNKDVKKAAFTMAETLLTLAIIGVVMALMLRAINRVNPDKNKVLFLKSYHAIETVIADIINDSTKYDQYTDENADFSAKPLSTAKASYINKGSEVTVCEDGCDKKFTQPKAVCYFLADQINTIGEVNCDNDTTMNFKTSIGACFWGWQNVDSNGTLEAIVDPTCSDDKKNGYVVKLFKDGKMTVPETSTKVNDQATAYEWMQNQTQVK